jgi:hypothetical protein
MIFEGNEAETQPGMERMASAAYLGGRAVARRSDVRAAHLRRG